MEIYLGKKLRVGLITMQGYFSLLNPFPFSLITNQLIFKITSGRLVVMDRYLQKLSHLKKYCYIIRRNIF